MFIQASRNIQKKIKEDSQKSKKDESFEKSSSDELKFDNSQACVWNKNKRGKYQK